MIIGRRGLLKLTGISSAAAALNVAIGIEGRALAASPPPSSGPNGSSTPAPLPFALTTPARIRAAALRVRDIDTIAGYYRQVLGLTEISRDEKGRLLGAGGTALLHLVHTPDAPVESRRSAGLFHIAYLMPSREDLARWLVHAARIQVPIDGFADHNVSEAIYLSDPEGNGIEVYADRPRENWQWQNGLVTMGTQHLDIDAIVRLTDVNVDEYDRAPAHLRIGHMHLRVGEIAAARGFYETALGLDSTLGNRADSAFLSSGGYHHHVAVNTWQSIGAGPRDPGQTGLDWFSMAVADPGLLAAQKQRLASAGSLIPDADGIEARDPWGTRVRLEPA